MSESGPTWELTLPRGRAWRLGPRPAVQAILNVTPDSFSDGGRFADAEAAIEEGLRLVHLGADAIDVGGESTRPGSDAVPSDEQIRRVAPVIQGLRERTDVPISIDTRDPVVAAAALEAGADVINDVNACQAPGWEAVLRDHRVPVILMHMRGTPRDMQGLADYPEGVVSEVVRFLRGRMAALDAIGVESSRVILDPGLGFAKTAEHNLEIVKGLDELVGLGRPVLFGASRKLFLGKILGQRASERGKDPRERDIGTVAINAVACLRGVSILRVHNVQYARDLVDVIEALRIVAS